MARLYFTPLLVILLFISCKVSIQQLDVHTFVEGEDLVVICNPDAVGLDNSFTQITSVALNYVADDQGKTGTRMAIIKQRDLTHDGKRITGKAFDQWTFAMPEYADLDIPSRKDNRGYMTIRATKTNAKCQDGGVYDCVVKFFDNGGELVRKASTNYTGRGLISIHDMTVSSTKVLGYNTYGENSTMTFTCRADGPQNYEFRWHKRCPSANVTGTPQFVSWPNPYDIQENTISIKLDRSGQESDCRTFRHVEKLVFKALLEENNCVIRCQFGSVQSGFNAYSKERTILVKREVSSQPIEEQTFVIGGDLVVTCDADAVGLKNSITQITSISLHFVVDRQDKSEMEVAYIRQRNGDQGGERHAGMAFSRWTLVLPPFANLDSQLPNDNREAMAVRATKTNAKCQDGGVFKCSVEYIDNGPKFVREKSTDYVGDESQSTTCAACKSSPCLNTVAIVGLVLLSNVVVVLLAIMALAVCGKFWRNNKDEPPKNAKEDGVKGRDIGHAT